MAFPILKLTSDERRLMQTHGHSRASSLIKTYNTYAKKSRGAICLEVLGQLDTMLAKAIKDSAAATEDLRALLARLIEAIKTARKALAASGVKA